MGQTKACCLSTICFGIYYWFTFNPWGKPLMMLFTFLITAQVALSWAFTFAKTGFTYLPTALHFGWNVLYTVVFSTGSAGKSIFVRENDNQLQGVGSILVFLFQVFALPMLIVLYLNRMAKN